MKTIRLFGITLLTVLMSVSFSACSSSDDDDNGGGNSASVEGTWYKKSSKWYKWDYTKNVPDMSSPTRVSTSEETWIFTKNGSNLKVKNIFTEDGKTHEGNVDFIHISGNEYKIEDDRIVFNSITSTSMTMEVYYDYYDDNSNHKEYEVMTLKK